ncbi:long chain acyl-CoA synthetase 1-like [Ananas comosus]|uniref:Long-chain-fatty-acid--CoA ligase n=1 Tax=Ananas comosus TaxID=4615 RepID=A0A6P5G100_ANACO|nr:long chain acyl-CoA synthetase 1-like [Ananas comosus]XP_020102296.1 long chain acyl-CoA synthetase 1-like [Ananas comosus]XP_020102298.1 long chain acyl-CoA synthetase 1-like [Ananas comosus]XP_020102299.1 long chain acyl-CoA synthetase 1-like [Ananas comosus]
MRKVYTVQVESGRAGKDGRPSVGPVYRSALAKDGFPPPDPRMSTSWDIFSVAAEKYPNNRMLGWREFVKGKPGCYIWKTYKEVYEEVVQVGSALRQMGAAPGSRIGIYGANCPQWIEAMEACNGYSLICVPLYDTLGSGAVDYILDQAEIDIAFVQDKKMKELLFSDCASLRRLKVIVSFTSTTMEQEEAASKIGLQIYSWNDFLRMGKENLCEPLPPRPLDICTIMYTSGTSGNPKGVILTHESNAMYVRGVDLYMDLFDDKMTVDDVYLSFLPLAHILDRMLEEYFFHKGASVGYYHGDINALRDDLMELKPTLFAGVPRVFERVHEGILKALSELWPHRRMIFNALYKHKLSWMRSGYSHKTASPLADFLAFSKIKARLGGRVRLIISGGAPLNTEIEEFLRVTSCAYVTQGYGLTETCGLSSNGVPDEMSLIGTVGVASTYTELRLEEVPEMGYDPLSVPSRGEICVRGKTLFSGYYKNPELTKEVMIDGWFHTGDIGEISPEGVLKIIDRKKNIFKLSHGEYVAAEYLEKVYGYLPIIEDIWVYGDSYRSMLVAVVAPHEDNTMKWAESNGHKGSFYDICALEELKIYILQELKALAEKNKLRGFECIKGVVVDPVPFNVERDLMTPTMKKKRSQMFKHYQSEIEKLYKNLAERRGDNNKVRNV